MPSIRDIAKAAGVSKSTVADALKNRYGVAPATRERVQAAAKALGYRPNPLVMANMAHVRSNRPANFKGALAWLTYNPRPSERAPGGNPDVFLGARERAEELGFALEVFSYNDPECNRSRLARILMARNIRGALIGPPQNPAEVIDDFPWEHFASVSVGYTLEFPNVHRVCPDYWHGFMLVYTELIKRGFRRIGLAVPEELERRHHYIGLGAYGVALRKQPARDRLPPLVAEDWGKAVFQRWFERHRPDAIVTIHKDILPWLAEMGARVPQDVGVATLFSASHTRPLSGLLADNRRMGRNAVDLLAAQLYRNEYGIPQQNKLTIVPGFWYEGETLPARK